MVASTPFACQTGHNPDRGWLMHSVGPTVSLLSIFFFSFLGGDVLGFVMIGLRG